MYLDNFGCFPNNSNCFPILLQSWIVLDVSPITFPDLFGCTEGAASKKPATKTDKAVMKRPATAMAFGETMGALPVQPVEAVSKPKPKPVKADSKKKAKGTPKADGDTTGATFKIQPYKSKGHSSVLRLNAGGTKKQVFQVGYAHPLFQVFFNRYIHP